MPLWWNWYTRQVEGLCLNGHAGSSPVGGIKKGGTITGNLVKIPPFFCFYWRW